MTSPNYLDYIPDSIVELFSEVHLEIIQDACRRIASLGEITSATEYQIERAQMIGASYDFILDKMTEGTGMSRDMLADLLNDAAVKTLRSDDAIHRLAGKSPVPLADSPALQNILRAGMEQTTGTFINLTQSTAYYGSEQLGRILDKTWLNVASGAFSYDAAIKASVVELTKSGITAVQYVNKKGHTITNNIDVVVRRATLSGINQTACKLQLARMQEMETEYVETTAHAGARDTHAVWQGLVFQLVGSSNLYPNFYDATGYGTKTGLGGINCRHGFYPFYPGISKPANQEEYLDGLNSATVKVDGREVSIYEASQIQRAHEREIREWKRVVYGLDAAGKDSSYEQGELKAWQAALRNLVEQTGLHRDYTRERAGRQYVA